MVEWEAKLEYNLRKKSITTTSSCISGPVESGTEAKNETHNIIDTKWNMNKMVATLGSDDANYT